MKTHTFRLGKYYIDQEKSRIDGLCEQPSKSEKLYMIILDGDEFKHLSSALHEGLHAEGIPDKYLHKEDGSSDTERLARFLWRLGYRKVGDK